MNCSFTIIYSYSTLLELKLNSHSEKGLPLYLYGVNNIIRQFVSMVILISIISSSENMYLPMHRKPTRTAYTTPVKPSRNQTNNRIMNNIWLRFETWYKLG